MSRTFTPSRTQILPSSPRDSEGAVLCSGHKRKASRFQAGPTTKNAGRYFYSCAYGKNDDRKCKYFQWEDELEPASASGRTLGTPSSVVANGRLGIPTTPSRAPPKAPPQVDDFEDTIDWSQVDTDELEREAIASTPGSSQTTQPQGTPQTPSQIRLQAMMQDSRKRKREDEETPKRGDGDLHPALDSLSEVSETLYRYERLLAAAEKAKEGFRKTVKRQEDTIAELRERVKDLGG